LGPRYLIECLPYFTELNLGIVKSDCLKLYLLEWIFIERRSGKVNGTTFTDTEVNNYFSIYHTS